MPQGNAQGTDRRQFEGLPAAQGRDEDLDGGLDPPLQALHRRLSRARGRGVRRDREPEGRVRCLPRRGRHQPALPLQDSPHGVQPPPGNGLHDERPHAGGHDRGAKRDRRRVRGGGPVMAGTASILDDAEQRARWEGFAWTEANARAAAEIIARYPEGRQKSAVIPLLDLAQRQVGAETQTQGWLPIPVMEFVGKELAMPFVRVIEVATFYTMFNLAPVGRFHVQVCGTTPCMLRGSDDVFAACKKRGLRKGHTTEDGLFTLTEVECLGACANAPMVQINDDNYEDLTEESMGAILDALAAG